jgi:AbrB family looped-hinge helix DNA binding protein
MPRVQIGRRHQVTTPAEPLKRLGLAAGEELEVIEHDEMLVLVPAKHIPMDQGWYYIEAWQRMRQEAVEDLKRGAVAGPFARVEELIADLRS